MSDASLATRWSSSASPAISPSRRSFPRCMRWRSAASSTCRSIGVARSGWTREQLIERARESITAHGELDDDAFAKLASLLRYVDGDYNDAATFTRLKRALGVRDAAAALLRHPAEHVSRRRQEPRRRRLPGRARASSSRNRSGAICNRRAS